MLAVIKKIGQEWKYAIYEIDPGRCVSKSSSHVLEWLEEDDYEWAADIRSDENIIYSTDADDCWVDPEDADGECKSLEKLRECTPQEQE